MGHSNQQNFAYVYACSSSRDAIMEWESHIKELAQKKGIEYKGPMRPPPTDISGKSFRQRKFRFDLSDRTRDLLQIEPPDKVFVQISFDTKVDFRIKEIIPESEIPHEGRSDYQSNSENTSLDPDDSIKCENNKPRSKSDGQINKEQSKQSSQNHDVQSSEPASELEKLREQAEQAAVETVPESVVTTQQTKQQYTRSSKVREYVLARADGYCEGCDEPAPFTSKSGDPYLHAHHINELSDGGSDTPDTVIALCPNCHYRVHHGGDGEKYNQELSDKLNNIESESGSPSN